MGAGTVLSIAKGAKEAQRELARAGGAKREAALREPFAKMCRAYWRRTAQI